MKERIIPYMKKRTAVIAALVSLMPMGQSLVIGTGATLTSAALILSVPEKAKAETGDVYFDRAYDKAEKGDYYGAIADYTKVIEINPRNAAAYNNRGSAKSNLNDDYGAIADYTKAMRLTQKMQLPITIVDFRRVI